MKHITPFRLEPVLQERKLLCLEAWNGYLFAGELGRILACACMKGQASQNSRPVPASPDQPAPLNQCRHPYTPVISQLSRLAELYPSFANHLRTCAASRAGLSDGSVLLIRNKAAAGEPPQWAVSDAVRGFARRRVSQLAVSHSKSMLLSLTEEGMWVEAFWCGMMHP